MGKSELKNKNILLRVIRNIFGIRYAYVFEIDSILICPDHLPC